MDVAGAWAVLERLPQFEVKPGLTRTSRLLEAAGNPQDGFPAIHVAGTNGKGSVVAMLGAILRAAGYRVGRYTSPELIDPRDRIVVDGAWISEEAFAQGVARLEPHLFPEEDGPTQFEAITALAFDHFRREGVDLAVVEVGLGGRFDSTNVVRPLVSVLTNVSLDHTKLLGESLEQIAWEKAGIAKADVPLILGPMNRAARDVIRREAEAAGAPVIDAELFPAEAVSQDWNGLHLRMAAEGFPQRARLSLAGGYQIDNLRVALTAVELLRTQGWRVPAEAVADGLASVRWPGRFEVVRRRPTVVLEGAHNPDGTRRLVRDIMALGPAHEHRHLLFGALADKDVAGMGSHLAPAFARVAVCRSESPRALPADKIAGLFEEQGTPVTWYDSVAEALDEFLPALTSQDVLVVAGSLTVVSEARRRLLEGHEDAG